MAFFGLSPLFLSLLASRFFTDPTTGLNVTRFMFFLAFASGITHLIGAFTLRVPTSQCGVASKSDGVAPVASCDEVQSSIDERQPLLPKTSRSDAQAVDANEGSSVLHLFRDPCFWSLAFVVLIILGSCEMIISSIGTIVLSLCPEPISGISSLSSSAETVTTTQVRLISIANTLSRLISGPLADFISPLPSHIPASGPPSSRKCRISRVVILSGTSLLLAGAYIYLELAIRTPDDLWILSVATGVTYGTTFTILPSIVSSVWGKADSGRNFGLITYAPFFGTTLFSYLYAFVSAHNSVNGGVCNGVTCWSLTFWVCTGAALLSFVASILLGQRWKGLV